MQVPPAEDEDWYCRFCIAKKQELHHDKKKKKRKKKVKITAQYKSTGSNCVRPGVIIPSITKVKAKDAANKSVKNVKTKKVPKGDKMQMKPLKGKSIAAKGKATKSVMKVKTVKKKQDIVMSCNVIQVVGIVFCKLCDRCK